VGDLRVVPEAEFEKWDNERMICKICSEERDFEARMS